MNQVKFPEDFSDYVIGEKYPVLKADNPKSNSSAALSMISQARHSIDIFTHTLEPNILDTQAIADAVLTFIKISSNSRLRILLCDPSIVVKQGHRLVTLAQKFPSYLSIRKTNQEYQATAFSLLMVDGKALLFRPHYSDNHAIVDYAAQYTCRQHLNFYNEVWDRSEPASEIRQLFI